MHFAYNQAFHLGHLIFGAARAAVTDLSDFPVERFWSVQSVRWNMRSPFAHPL